MISVIVPAYNASRKIKKCLDSICIAAEKFHDVEIIIVNDGSTDNTAEIVASIAAGSTKNIKHLSKPNGGVSSARNYGLSVAKGDWIMFVDADDEVSKDIFDLLLPIISEPSFQSINCLMFSYFIRNTGHSYSMSFPDKIQSLSEILSSETNIKIIDTLLCTVWNKVYSNKIIKSNNIIFPEDIKVGEDFIFNTLYFKYVSNIKLISAALYYYNCFNDQSAVGKFYSKYDTYIHAMTIAYNNLLSVKIAKTPAAFNIRNKFIAERWLYATQRCIEVCDNIKEESNILKHWYESIEEIYLSAMADIYENGYHIIAKNYIRGKSMYIPLYKLKCRDLYFTIKRKTYQLLKG